VMLNFSNSPSVCACVVASAVYLGTNQIAGSAANAADCLANTLSTMGNTSGTTQRLRITLDFSCRPTPARSSTWGSLKLHYR